MTAPPIDPREVEPEPWRNGAGSTRELASETSVARTQWRVSLAELDDDADSSGLPGMERLFVPLGHVRLEITGTRVRPPHGKVCGSPARCRSSVTVADVHLTKDT